MKSEYKRTDCICEINSDRMFKFFAPWLKKDIWPDQNIRGTICLYDELSYSVCIEHWGTFGGNWFWVPVWDVSEDET